MPRIKFNASAYKLSPTTPSPHFAAVEAWMHAQPEWTADKPTLILGQVPRLQDYPLRGKLMQHAMKNDPAFALEMQVRAGVYTPDGRPSRAFFSAAELRKNRDDRRHPELYNADGDLNPEAFNNPLVSIPPLPSFLKANRNG